MERRYINKTALILDTCVWCNFLQNREWDFTMFKTLNQLLKEEEIILFVPEQVKIEWERNYNTVIERLDNSTHATINQAKKLADFLPDYDKEEYLQSLEKTEFTIRINMKTRNTSIAMLIDDLIKTYSVPIDIESPEVKELIVDFGLKGKKPYTNSKNSTGDAVIFFTIYEHFKGKLQLNHTYKDIYFVTTNPEDFSQSKTGKDQNFIHEDLKPYADEIGLKYSVNIARTINDIHSNMIEKAIEDGLDEELIYRNAINPECPNCSTQMKSYYAPSTFGFQRWIHECIQCGHLIRTSKEIDISGM
ncbi:DUF4935 domain-containing protein [Bacillus cereus]